MPKKKKHQIRADEELAKQLQAEINEENRIAREKSQQFEEVNFAWDDVQVLTKSSPRSFPSFIRLPKRQVSKFCMIKKTQFVQTFLRKFNRYSFFKTPKVLLLAWDRVSEIKDAFGNKKYKQEDIQELFCKLFNDVQSIHKELAKYINTPGWNRPAFCNNGDDDEEDCTIAVTPDFPITDSLIIENEHLDTILETESDEFIQSCVENLVPIPSESEDFSDIESECDMPNCDDSQTTNFSTFSNPLFDDSTFSDDESSHEEVIHEISFKTYSNPLFDLDEKIISSEFNPTTRTPKGIIVF
nr:hypothetical protein [Tanacetum cinerariifolium]